MNFRKWPGAGKDRVFTQPLPSTSKPAPVQSGAACFRPLGTAPNPLPLPLFEILFFRLPSLSLEGCWFCSVTAEFSALTSVDMVPVAPEGGSPADETSTVLLCGSL